MLCSRRGGRQRALAQQQLWQRVHACRHECDAVGSCVQAGALLVHSVFVLHSPRPWEYALCTGTGHKTAKNCVAPAAYMSQHAAVRQSSSATRAQELPKHTHTHKGLGWLWVFTATQLSHRWPPWCCIHALSVAARAARRAVTRCHRVVEHCPPHFFSSSSAIWTALSAAPFLICSRQGTHRQARAIQRRRGCSAALVNAAALSAARCVHRLL